MQTPKRIKAHNPKLNLTFIYDKIKDAEAHLQCNSSVIVKVCKGKLESSWGWKFEYYRGEGQSHVVTEPLLYDRKKTPWNSGTKKPKVLKPTSTINGKHSEVTKEILRQLAIKQQQNMTPEQKEEISKKLSAANKEWRSKRTQEQKEQTALKRRAVQRSFTNHELLTCCNDRQITLLQEIPDDDNKFMGDQFIKAKCRCGYEWEPSAHGIVRKGITSCGCVTSIGQQDLTKFINQYCEVKTNNRPSWLDRKELDIVIPEKNLAVEYHGLYWHSTRPVHNKDNQKIKTTHEWKYLTCKEHGVKLIQIFEDEWLTKQDIVKSMLLNRLGQSQTKISARKCNIINDKSRVAEFFKQNHISGDCANKAAFALEYKGEVVAAISVRTPFTSKHKGSLEIARFASKLNTNVQGAFQKLLKVVEKYCKDNKINSILSYADCRWGSGEVYIKAGFSHLGKTKPNYFYEKGGVRETRQKHMKNNDPEFIAQYGKTEAEQNHNQGWYEIYDAGSEIYLKQIN